MNRRSYVACSDGNVTYVPFPAQPRRLNPLTGQWVEFDWTGAITGTSNVDCTETINREDAAQYRHFQKKGVNLLGAYAAMEERKKTRLIIQTVHWVAVVPFWASQPYEILLLPRSPTSCFNQLSRSRQVELAGVLDDISERYQAVFAGPARATVTWHEAPGGIATDHWRLHAHLCPTVRINAPLAPMTPERCAEKLRRAVAATPLARFAQQPPIHQVSEETRPAQAGR